MPLYRKNAKTELKPENRFLRPPKPKTGFENYGTVLDSLKGGVWQQPPENARITKTAYVISIKKYRTTIKIGHLDQFKRFNVAC